MKKAIEKVKLNQIQKIKKHTLLIGIKIKRLSEILEFKIKDSKLNKRPSFNIDILKDDDKRKVFIDYFGEIIKDIKKSE